MPAPCQPLDSLRLAPNARNHKNEQKSPGSPGSHTNAGGYYGKIEQAEVNGLALPSQPQGSTLTRPSSPVRVTSYPGNSPRMRRYPAERTTRTSI
jgi:hypothetical protein